MSTNQSEDTLSDAPRKKFSEQTNAWSAVSLVQRLGACHNCYTRYTTVDRICEIIESGRMWFNRADSNAFDDAQETEKFGHYIPKRRLYYTCFNYAIAENAAMWGLYGQPTYQSIRISVGPRALNKWVLRLNQGQLAVWRTPRNSTTNRKTCGMASVERAGFNDIVYASVRKDENAPERTNTLFWNESFTAPIPCLDKTKNGRRLTGFLKDYEWHFEQESRLWIKTKETYSSKAILVEVPDDILLRMGFVLSPWCSTEEVQIVVNRLRTSFTKRFRDDRHFNESQVRESHLSGALKRWKERRGL